jgi:hypothetical protein
MVEGLLALPGELGKRRDASAVPHVSVALSARALPAVT